MIPANQRPRVANQSGTGYALAAYGLWGLLPLYWRALHGIPLGETLAHRILWSLVTILILLAAFQRMHEFFALLGDPVKRRMLGVSSLLIGANWSIYILAVYRGELVQASLGYYINPLMSVAMGVFFLKERLNKMQTLAVSLAGLGVLILTVHHHGLPFVALGLAITFALYGFVKKRLGVDALAGLAAETLWLTPLAIAYLVYLNFHQVTSALLASGKSAGLLLGTGAVTLAPLFFFNGAAKRLPLSTLGFFQYLSPSLQLILAVVFFHESFTGLHAAAFGLIWAALALYSWDAIRRAGKSTRGTRALPDREAGPGPKADGAA